MGTLDIERDVPLAPLTTLRLGGPAKHFIHVGTEQRLADALGWAAEHDVRSAILGGGSNLIVADAGFDGLVIQIGMNQVDFRDGGFVHVGAGVPWERIVEASVSRGWAGLECLTGIPGSTGATPIQNVGAYGQEVAEVIERVRVLRRDDHEIEELQPSDCQFGYRDSVFKREPHRFVVTSVDFKLTPGGMPCVRYGELQQRVARGASLRDVRQTVFQLRREKSMVIDPNDPNNRSAGSFFLNPIVSSEEADRVTEQALRQRLVDDPRDVPRYAAEKGHEKLAAGWLIEKSGIAKGTRRGAIGVSTKHALALVHLGGGTTAELLRFADEIRDRVQQRFGVTLEREPRLLA